MGIGKHMGAGITKIFGVHDKFSENGGGFCRFMLKPAISFLGRMGLFMHFNKKLCDILGKLSLFYLAKIWYVIHGRNLPCYKRIIHLHKEL